MKRRRRKLEDDPTSAGEMLRMENGKAAKRKRRKHSVGLDQRPFLVNYEEHTENTTHRNRERLNEKRH